MQLVPVVNSNNTKTDLYSRLLEDRVILLSGEINDAIAELVIAQLLYLESENPEKDIQLYITSPGGSVMAGMAIFDTMRKIKCDVSTICVGYAASMGAFLLSGGAKGKRFVTENAEVMIHQPLGGAQGQSTDILIAAKHIEKTRKKLEEYMAEASGQTYEKVHADCERDNWMTAEEALNYGLIDEIIKPE